MGHSYHSVNSCLWVGRSLIICSVNSYFIGSNVSRELVNITDARYSSAANASTSLNLTCKEDFVEIDYVCQPRCDRFMSNSKAVTYSVLVIQIVLAVIGLIVASGILIISFIRFRVRQVTHTVT